MSYRKLCTYLLIMYFCTFSLGIIEYIGNTNNISFIQKFFTFFVNRTELVANITRVFSEAYGKYRIAGIFHEPGTLAAFTFVSSPIIYFLCTCKMKLLKYRGLDKFVKVSTLVLMVTCFIGTQSPINLCFMLIFLGCAFVKKIVDIKIQYKGIILFSLFCISITFLLLALNIFSVNNVDISETYLNRIVKTIENFTSMAKLVDAEPSLATRVCNWAADFIIAVKYPIFGFGYGNIMNIWPQTILALPFPIPMEIYINASLKNTTAVSTMLWKLMSETGFVGMGLFYTFMFNILVNANKVKKYYCGISHGLISSLQIALLLYICTSFYIFLQSIMWVYFGILESMILNASRIKMIIKKGYNNYE
ncbi:MAG: hypothetical protein ACI4PI_03135 [Oscillospiraceae bacterium]